MHCVIELQGYTDCKQFFCPKEICLKAEDNEKHFVITPPVSLCALSEKDQKIINWATCRYHHIPWIIGAIDIDTAIHYLRKETIKYSHIVTKGKVKAAYLSRVLGRHVIDLTTHGCPSVRFGVTFEPCNAHFNKKNTHCALASARFIDGWIYAQEKLSGKMFEGL
jgi:hypothetical protein